MRQAQGLWGRQAQAVSLRGPWGEFPGAPDNQNPSLSFYEIPSASVSTTIHIILLKVPEPVFSSIGYKKLLAFLQGTGWISDTRFGLLQEVPKLHWWGDKILCWNGASGLSTDFIHVCSLWYLLTLGNDLQSGFLGTGCQERLASVFIHSSIYLPDTW